MYPEPTASRWVSTSCFDQRKFVSWEIETHRKLVWVSDLLETNSACANWGVHTFNWRGADMSSAGSPCQTPSGRVPGQRPHPSIWKGKGERGIFSPYTQTSSRDLKSLKQRMREKGSWMKNAHTQTKVGYVTVSKGVCLAEKNITMINHVEVKDFLLFCAPDTQ